MLTDLLRQFGKICSEEDLKFVTLLFEHHTEGIPKNEYIIRDSQKSSGFYFLYLKLTIYEADPKVFFQLLRVDQKIGWANPAGVEIMVFEFKALKIIEEEKVTDRTEHFYI